MNYLPLEHVLVLSVSTMPRTGFIALLAIPVLKAIEVMSKIAVPVVSEPVPAVVGTICGAVNMIYIGVHAKGSEPAINGRSFSLIGRPFPTGALMKSNRSASL